MSNYQSNCIRAMFAMACLFALQITSAQWPQWRGPLRDGHCTESNLLKTWSTDGPKLIWTSDTLGEGFSSAIIQDKIIYTTGKRDSVEFLSALDFNGKLIWQKELGKALKADWPESRSTPTLYKNKLYAVTVRGDVSCLDTKTGELNWQINLAKKFDGVSSFNGFGESPLVDDDKVILTPCGKTTTLIALDSQTGETIWTSESVSDTNNYVSPILVRDKGKKLIITSLKNNILAADLNTGKIIWRDKIFSCIVPLPDNKKVYFSSFMGGKMLTLNDDLNSVNVQWSDTIKANWMGGTVRLGNKIFGTFDHTKGLFCLDYETGKTLFVNKEISSANLLAADGMIYSYEEKTGRVCLLKPSDNGVDMVSSFKVKLGKGPNLAHMSIANGTLFVRHGKYLMAYDVKQL